MRRSLPLKMAESAANSVVSATMGAENYLFSESNTPGESEWTGIIKTIDGESGSEDEGVSWSKGSLFSYKVTLGVPTFYSKEAMKAEATIVMMVESPAIDNNITQK